MFVFFLFFFSLFSFSKLFLLVLGVLPITSKKKPAQFTVPPWVVWQTELPPSVAAHHSSAHHCVGGQADPPQLSPRLHVWALGIVWFPPTIPTRPVYCPPGLPPIPSCPVHHPPWVRGQTELPSSVTTLHLSARHWVGRQAEPPLDSPPA